MSHMFFSLKFLEKPLLLCSLSLFCFHVTFIKPRTDIFSAVKRPTHIFGIKIIYGKGPQRLHVYIHELQNWPRVFAIAFNLTINCFQM